MSNKPKRMKPTITQLLPIVHKLFGKENHYLSHWGCKKRAVQEFYRQLDEGEQPMPKYQQRHNPIYTGNRRSIPTTE